MISLPKESWEMCPIGFVSSSFKEKFGIPRQPGLVSHAQGVITLDSSLHPDLKQACKELDQFSHLWILFVFHQNSSVINKASVHSEQNWKPAIRPPRLGGNKKVGVFSSRSPHRPNPIGMSVVKLEKVDLSQKKIKIYVSGLDLLDGTPVLDIKPYLPFSDSIPDAQSGWAEEAPPKYPVMISEKAHTNLLRLLPSDSGETLENIEKMIIEILELDPRPAYQKRRMPIGDEKSEGKKFGFTLRLPRELTLDSPCELTLDIRWHISGGKIVVHEVVEITS